MTKRRPWTKRTFPDPPEVKAEKFSKAGERSYELNSRAVLSGYLPSYCPVQAKPEDETVYWGKIDW